MGWYKEGQEFNQYLQWRPYVCFHGHAGVAHARLCMSVHKIARLAETSNDHPIQRIASHRLETQNFQTDRNPFPQKNFQVSPFHNFSYISFSLLRKHLFMTNTNQSGNMCLCTYKSTFKKEIALILKTESRAWLPREISTYVRHRACLLLICRSRALLQTSADHSALIFPLSSHNASFTSLLQRRITFCFLLWFACAQMHAHQHLTRLTGCFRLKTEKQGSTEHYPGLGFFVKQFEETLEDPECHMFAGLEA